MTERCADLDEFFDGELPAYQAGAFRDHLATCGRCQRVLEGRMQESIAVRVPAAYVTSVAPAVARASAPEIVVPSGATRAARVTTPRAPARRWGCSRPLAYAVPLLAAAAIPLYLIYRGDPEFGVSVAIERAEVIKRGNAAHVGDVLRLRPTGHRERYQVIWVYLDDRELIASCPRDARCSSRDGETALELPLIARGRYAIVGLGSNDALPEAPATLDKALATAKTTGAQRDVEYVDVD